MTEKIFYSSAYILLIIVVIFGLRSCQLNTIRTNLENDRAAEIAKSCQKAGGIMINYEPFHGCYEMKTIKITGGD